MCKLWSSDLVLCIVGKVYVGCGPLYVVGVVCISCDPLT